jgi:hypothetical protein
MFELNRDHDYSIPEVEGMYPFERDIYVGLAKHRIREELEK